MSSGQKIIKILATILAVFLAISIIGGIISGIVFAVNLDNKKETTTESELNISNDEFHYNNDENGIHINVGGDDAENAGEHSSESKGDDTMKDYQTYDFTETYKNVESLDIQASINDVILLEGTEFCVTMKDVSTKCKAYEKNGVLTVEDTSHYSGHSFVSWVGDMLDGKGFKGLKGGTITITYPKGFTANNCEIEAATGSVTMSDLQTNNLDIEAGTGSVTGTNIIAGYIDLECGTGSVNIDNSSFAGSDIEAGTGTITINGKMTGQNSIECGVGTVYLGLEDSQDSYKMDIEKGLGTITIDGSSYSSIQTSSPNAANSLSIEGGIGNITIDFARQF